MVAVVVVVDGEENPARSSCSFDCARLRFIFIGGRGQVLMVGRLGASSAALIRSNREGKRPLLRGEVAREILRGKAALFLP
jgi:hypothetical protein